MTDQPQIHIDPTEGSQLRLKQAASPADTGKLFISVTGDNGVVATTYIPPAALLAMIDTTAPEAMRGYLRERSDYLDSPHDRPNLAGTGDGPAAEHFDHLDAVPEADSPEDVDEHPAPVITVITDSEALDAIELLGRVMADLRDAYARGLAR